MRKSVEVTIPLAEIAKFTRVDLQDIIMKSVYRVAQHIKQNPFIREMIPFDTGELYRTMQVEVREDNSLRVWFPAPHAAFAQWGAEVHQKPHRQRSVKEGPYPIMGKGSKTGDKPRFYTYGPIEAGRHKGYEGRFFLEKLRPYLVDWLQTEIISAVLAHDFKRIIEEKGGL